MLMTSTMIGDVVQGVRVLKVCRLMNVMHWDTRR